MFSRFFLSLFILTTIIYFIPENTNANIYQLNCKSKKNSTTWVYSIKRKQVILTNINNSKTKVNFTMTKWTPTSFSSKGVVSKYKTNVTYNQNTNELAMLQKSLRGSNQFYKCQAPSLIKEE